jgi:hypothetical protein
MVDRELLCSKCGKKVAIDALFCTYCGNKISVSIPNEEERKTEGEYLLGGFNSLNLTKELMAGYGIYVTNKRIIGAKSVDGRELFIYGALAGSLAPSIGIGGSLGVLGGELAVLDERTKEESKKALRELEQKKDFEARKEQVTSIELKKPGIIRTGHFIITLNTRKRTKIDVWGNKEFDALLEMMNRFVPEIFKVIR